MTDQKQAPERYSPAMLFSTQKPATMHKELHGEFVTYVAYAALAKQRDELASEVERQREITRCERLLTRDLKADLEIVTSRAVKAEAERDELAAAAKVLLDKHDELLKQSKFRTANSFRKIEVLAALRALAAQKGG